MLKIEYIQNKIPVLNKINAIKIFVSSLIVLFFGTIAFGSVFYIPAYPILLILIPIFHSKLSFIYVCLAFIMLLFSIVFSIMFSAMNFSFALMSVGYFMLSIFSKSLLQK